MGARIKLVDTDPSEVRRESDLSSHFLIFRHKDVLLFSVKPSGGS